MASSTDNVKLGVCQVLFGGSVALADGTVTGTQTDLGYTKGGVVVEVSTDTHPVTIDQFGESEISERITKRSVKVTVPLAETTLQNMVEVMPGATLIQGSGVEAGKNRVEVTNAVSTDLLSIAKMLVLHPINATDNNDDFCVLKAATAGALNFAYKIDEERIYNVVFTGYPDNANGDKVFTVGDYTMDQTVV